jgi:hypothetical protein
MIGLVYSDKLYLGCIQLIIKTSFLDTSFFNYTLSV